MTHDDSVEMIIAEQADFPPVGAPTRKVDMSAITVWMLGHAHIDLGYRWDLSETVHRIAPWTFAGVLRMMEQHPGFVFAQSQMFLYDAMKREYPRLFDRIRNAIDAGRWDVIGGGWCEYDTSLCSGESIIRQHLYGTQYAREQLGVDCFDTAFVPDSFIGHPRTLPQILSGCGFSYYVFGRGLPQNPERPEDTRRAFRWKGPDGSELIAYLPFGPYSNPPMDEQHLVRLSAYVPAAVSDQELALFGVGDHGGGPREPDFQALAELDRIAGAPKWRYGRLSECMAAAFTGPVRAGLRTRAQSLEAFASGALTSQAQTKRANRILEHRLPAAEALAAVATALQRKPAYPRVDFQDIWRTLLTYQFHDILPGTSVASVYRAASQAYRESNDRLDAMDRDSVVRIGTRIDTGRLPGYPFVVVNPTTGPWRGVVELRIPKHIRKRLDGSYAVLTAGANDASDLEPVEKAVLKRKKILLSTELPSLGYRTYTVAPQPGPRSRGTGRWCSFDRGVFESPRYTIELSRKTGDVIAVTDTKTGRSILQSPSNTLELWNEHELATSWVEVLDERGPNPVTTKKPKLRASNEVSATIKTKSRTETSTFTRSITIYRDLDRIEMNLTMDWHEPNCFLKLCFLPGFPLETVTTSLPYGSQIVQEPESEFLMHDWVDVGGPDHGLTVLNDGAYGADLCDGALRVSVIRNVRDMDPSMSLGRHQLRYALLPRSGPFVRSAIEQDLRSFLTRPSSAWTGRHPGGLKTWGTIDTSKPIPGEHSFAEIDCASVAVETFKMPDEAYTPEGFVLRLRELDGAPQSFSVRMPYPAARVTRTDHLERPSADQGGLSVHGDVVSGTIGPHELLTLIAYL